MSSDYLIFGFISCITVLIIAAVVSSIRPKGHTLSGTSDPLLAVAGDNPIDTHMDLARAYLEMGHLNEAKDLLTTSLIHASASQKNTINSLLKTL